MAALLIVEDEYTQVRIFDEQTLSPQIVTFGDVTVDLSGCAGTRQRPL